MARRSWRSVRSDLRAGIVLGVESVPDGLASGVLAGLNPLYGLNAYLFGMVGAAAFTSTTLMAVQSTGAMALVVHDANLKGFDDANRALFTLSVVTGLVMIAAAVLRADRLMRYVNSAVMTGFVSAVGVNIVLGQLADATGYKATGANRISRTIDLLVHINRVSFATVLVTVLTLVLIVVLERTRLGAFGMVVAVVVASVVPALWTAPKIALVRDIAKIPNSLPTPVLPDFSAIPDMIVVAISLAFIGLVQGAGVSAGISNPDGHRSNMNRDFYGQGAGNVVAGIFQGMPVGGSMSASALLRDARAKTRLALLIAGATMAAVILLAGNIVSLIAMPALAGLLILVGARSVRPSAVRSVALSGTLPLAVMGVTFVLTLVAPLQYAVLLGVGLSILARISQQANRVQLRRLQIFRDGRWRETDPPAQLAGRTIVALQPFGALFFASAPVLEAQLPKVSAASKGAVVILRLRGLEALGLNVIDVIMRYSNTLKDHGATLKVVLPVEHAVWRQARAEGLIDCIGEDNIYRGSEWVGNALRRAWDDAVELRDRGTASVGTVADVHSLVKTGKVAADAAGDKSDEAGSTDNHGADDPAADDRDGDDRDGDDTDPEDHAEPDADDSDASEPDPARQPDASQDQKKPPKKKASQKKPTTQDRDDEHP